MFKRTEDEKRRMKDEGRDGDKGVRYSALQVPGFGCSVHLYVRNWNVGIMEWWKLVIGDWLNGYW